ncbi:hypothetical protein A7M93_21165 [Acinetobacter baumannii]|nr:hypothetical protein A7M93_21165 [Acinetobacter baumannii]
MGQITRGPWDWTRPRRGKTSPQAFVKVPNQAKGVPARFVSVKPATAAKGHERRAASLPSPQHLPSEGPVRLSHLVPKTSLDGGDAALARSGPAGVFEVTVDGRGAVGLRVSRSAASCL